MPLSCLWVILMAIIKEWLGSTTTNRHGVTSFDFATVSGCNQLVVGPTCARGGTLDLLMTDVPNLVRVAVVAPIGSSDHSSLSAVISMAKAVTTLCVRKVFLKHQVNWNTVCSAIKDLPWSNICLANNPVEVLNEHLFRLFGLNVPTNVIRERNKEKPWFGDQCRHAFGLKQEAHLRWTRDRFQGNWEEFVDCQMRSNETNSETKRQFSDRNTAVLMNATPLISGGPLGYSSSLPPLVSEGGGLVCDSVGKADLLSDHFDSKQSREAVDPPLTCHPSPSLTTFVFRSKKVWRILLNLDPCGDTEIFGMFPIFLMITADVMAPGLSVVLRRLVRLGSFPCWRQAIVTPIPNGPPSSSVAKPTDFHNISIV